MMMKGHKNAILELHWTADGDNLVWVGTFHHVTLQSKHQYQYSDSQYDPCDTWE
jgi:hypothetical protein